MNKVLVAINIILVVAVGYLYYYNFSSKKTVGSFTSNTVSTKPSNSFINYQKIAYVELDSLNENLIYFKQQRKILEQKKKVVEDKISNDYSQLEARQNEFFKKNPNASPEEVQQLRAQLAQGQQQIEEEKQKQSQTLNAQSFELMEGIQTKLRKFLAEYNKEKKYQFILTTGSGLDYLIYKDSTLDITKDVINGMNKIMKPGANNNPIQ